MKTRSLGTKGFQVGEIGLGRWQLGADWGPSVAEAPLAILAAAVENGINFFDTANVYGSGRSEELIGRFIKACGQPVVVATKFGPWTGASNNYSEGVLRRSVDASLKRLGVDCPREFTVSPTVRSSKAECSTGCGASASGPYQTLRRQRRDRGRRASVS